jgi:uncharacterized membrane protein (UPF0127 family)
MTTRADRPRRLPACALAAALLLLAGPAAAQCAPGHVDVRSGDTVVRFAVTVADTDETRARGLMFVESMGRFEGMLFVYDAPQTATFWMENTPLPLDMLFFDGSGTLARVHANAEPFSRDIIFGGEAIRYVLEINGGQAAALGIAPGAEIRHPALDQDDAAWPCETAE